MEKTPYIPLTEDKWERMLPACIDCLRAFVEAYSIGDRKANGGFNDTVIGGIKQLVRGLPKNLRGRLLNAVPDVSPRLAVLFEFLRWEARQNFSEVDTSEHGASVYRDGCAVVLAASASIRKKVRGIF